ncbi:uncharacterized protein LOC133185166 [Saccostrea echinata]|uniref:uncharacterized protein LOC133185166 n=1 Tax=Saccostrea echinata TaxID=191078 RepID=UPI002A80289B|nr:uncharacterized protein LOC133185166 [Saccostrea echinata]
MERFGNKSIDQCLKSSLLDYLSKTKTRAMTPVRRNILQIVIFLFENETSDKHEFLYSDKKDIAVQQKRFIIFSYLFLEALKKNIITDKDITTHNRMWSQHLQDLVSGGNEKEAKNYLRILEDGEETIFNIKRFQRQLKATDLYVEFLAKGENDLETEMEEQEVKFHCRRPNLFERFGMKLKKLFN